LCFGPKKEKHHDAKLEALEDMDVLIDFEWQNLP
jgi:hypothetical protein